MSSEQSFQELRAGISSALVNTTRTAGQISNEDLAFQRSINPQVDRLLQEQNRRLLALVRDLNKSATAGTDTVPPSLNNVELVDDGWRGIVDVIDNLLEKADACLDEFTGVIKKLTPGQQNESATATAKRPLAKHEYRTQNILKPQRLFHKVPKNDEDTPFKPLLRSKPNATVSLEESLVTTPGPDGFLQYASFSKHSGSADALLIQTTGTNILTRRRSLNQHILRWLTFSAIPYRPYHLSRQVPHGLIHPKRYRTCSETSKKLPR